MTNDLKSVLSIHVLVLTLLVCGLTSLPIVNADDPPGKEVPKSSEEIPDPPNLDPSPSETSSSDFNESNEDEPELAKLETIESATAVSAVSQPRIPSVLPDGRPLVPIMMYQSQMDELIPETYRPVSVDRLTQAVQKMTNRATDDQASRLRGAVYWIQVVGEELVSSSSVIDIESDLRSVVRRSLGKVNLAIAPSQGRGPFALQSLPRLETVADGNLVAVFQGDSRLGNGIEFQWSLRGETRDFGTDFRLQLPRTPQTRIMISAPPDLSVEALDGVFREHLAPPPDARVTDSKLKWYEIDAGGLSQVRLRVRREQDEEPALIVRRTSMEYEASPSGLNWNCKMVVQLPSGQSFPPLEIREATITSLKVDGIQTQYRTKNLGGRKSQLQILPTAETTTGKVVTIVSLAGHSSWASRNSWCDLPMPMWLGSQVIHASPVDDVQLAVVDPVEMLEWRLPSDWKQSPSQGLDRETVYTADGPPVAWLPSSQSAKSTALSNEPDGNQHWSRVRFAGASAISSAETALKLEVEPGSLNATARIAIQLDREQIEPLRLLIEPAWTLTGLTFAKSGRVVENLNVNEKTHSIQLWPDVEDIGDGEITIEITGTKLLPNAPSQLTIPPTWFTKIRGARGNMVAAIVPREDLKWSGESAMHQGLIKPSQLNERQLQFFAGVDEETLWYRPENGHTPRVLMQTPSVSFNAASEFQITRDRDEIDEKLEIEFDFPGQSLKKVVVQTGPAENRPPLLWSIRGDEGTPSINLSSAAVTLGVGEQDGEEDGSYSIDVSDQNMRGKRLVGRRQYPVPNRAVFRLPTVSGAASQEARASIGAGLLVTQKSRSVQLVPPQILPSDKNASPVDITRIRYDAVEQPSITVARSDVSPSVSIVWREQIRVIASSRGTDRIEASYRVSPTEALEIQYEPELQLASVSRDGLPVDLITIEQRPSIILQPQAKTETIHVVWNRSKYGADWVRECRIPRIQISGTVLKSEYKLIAASDAFAPAALLHSGSGGHYGAVDLQPGDNTTLIRRNIALALGWMAAFLIFSLSWTVARRSPMLLVVGLVLLSTVSILWWPWRLAVIGWLIVPVVAAGLLASSRAWDELGSRFIDADHSSDQPKPPLANDASGDFSIESIARLMLWLILIGGLSTLLLNSQLEAQETEPQSAQASVAILVPVQNDGAVAGEMVYLPGSVHADLFRTAVSAKPQDARFQSAQYRVHIDPALRDSRIQSQAVVEAEFLIHVEDEGRISNRVRLPLAPDSVRRIEILGDVNRIVQFKEDATQGVVAVLPSGGDYRLRITMMPKIEQDDPWTKLTLAIPKVCSSRLTVETDQTFDAIGIGGEQGHLLEESELRRWVKDLGPIDSLDLRYRTLTRSRTATAQPLQRRYWVNAGKRHVVIDCEVEPPSDMATGEKFQFVVRDGEMPAIASANWKLDENEYYSSTQRRLLTFKCMKSSPGPVRLLWTQPATVNREDEINPVGIRIPEVIATALGENAPAWIALYSDSALQFAPLVGNNTERMTIGYFIDQWTGFRSRVDHAYRVIEGLPMPILQAQSVIDPNVSQRHHVHIKSDRLEVQYTAVLSPSDHANNRLKLNVPPDVQLIHVSVDGKELHSQAIRSGGSSEVLLGDVKSSEPVTIKALGLQLLPKEMRFSPPRFSLNLLASSELYSISRDRSTEVQMIESPSISDSQQQNLDISEDSLARGWLPLTNWVISANETQNLGDSIGGLFEVKTRPIRFDSRQLIALSRDNDGWAMETLIAFRPNRSRPGALQVPDFIDVEIPSRWCDSLEISPKSDLSQSDATDDAFQIVRIRCDSEQLRRGFLSIRGRLKEADAGRINVPSVRVLGLGQRQVYISVPDQVMDDSIQWRTSAVEAAKPSKDWRSTEYVSDSRSLYTIANPSWSIDLAPLPTVDADAHIGAMDVQVFAQSDGALALCHWDLFPGSMESVKILLPHSAEVIGIWSAGQAAPIRSAFENEPDEDRLLTEAIEVPLALSRLPQTLQVLIRVSANAAKQGRYIPELIGIPSFENWIVNYSPSDGYQGNPVSRSEERAIRLAESVVAAVEALEPERPREECAAWLQVWLNRYRLISDSVGREVRFDLSAIAPAQEPTDTESGSDQFGMLEDSTLDAWESLDARMSIYVKRFLPDQLGQSQLSRDNLSLQRTADFQFAVSDFEGFEVNQITAMAAGARPQFIQLVSSNDRGLRNLLMNVLTLILICGMLIVLRPFQSYVFPIVVHPAFWLGLLGIFGFAVAPIPVAWALVLVAVALPVFPSQKITSRG